MQPRKQYRKNTHTKTHAGVYISKAKKANYQYGYNSKLSETDVNEISNRYPKVC